jgi:predicted MPP superfamily phosphohydrolase
VKEISIPIRDLPRDLQDFHIVQLSDIHIGPTIKGDYLLGIVERCNELHPDMVAITGDLIDGLTSQLQEDVAPLAQLRSRHGSYFVTGNHEYYWDANTWTALLETLGVKVLLNENRVIRHGNARLMVAGVTDYAGDKYVPDHVSDPQQARRHATRTDAAILLAHQPRSAFAGEAAGYDLQLSGHVHGGQFMPWNLFIKQTQRPYVAVCQRRHRLLGTTPATGSGAGDYIHQAKAGIKYSFIPTPAVLDTGRSPRVTWFFRSCLCHRPRYHHRSHCCPGRCLPCR